TLASVSRDLSTAVENRGDITIIAMLSKDRLDLARRILVVRLASSKPADAEQVEITVIYDQVESVRQLLQFGAHLRVTSPPEARAVMRDVATAMAALY
ncbi:WYL domain-containing protein, partial [Cryobacterium sp. TMT1-3]|uniref:WYL domain-containing protein n=1 Tax=Cryobacterium sp. TMT1-3 TaxID=1259237 RepID=UPI001F541DD7